MKYVSTIVIVGKYFLVNWMKYKKLELCHPKLDGLLYAGSNVSSPWSSYMDLNIFFSSDTGVEWDLQELWRENFYAVLSDTFKKTKWDVS